MTASCRRILLVNPFIYDFSAHDSWAKPKGLLDVGRTFRQMGHDVCLLDCLDNRDPDMAAFAASHPGIERPRYKKFGTGSHFREEVAKTGPLIRMPRRRLRYGLHPEVLRQKLLALPARPDLIGVSGIMTYWWRGVRDTITIIKDCLPGVPVVLGGIYPSLLPGHALKKTGADIIFSGRATPEGLGQLLERAGITGPPPPSEAIAASGDTVFYPYPKPSYGVINTSEGCARKCTYCASRLLRPQVIEYPVEQVLADLHLLAGRGIQDFAFYDDFLLYAKERRLWPLLERISRELPGLRFHTPNGLHLDLMDQHTAALMRACNFTTLRFGFETANPDLNQRTGAKIGPDGLAEKLNLLKEAGFQGEQLGLYAMIGLPGQTVRDVEDTLALVKDCGVRAFITEFSPIPGTKEFARALAVSPVDFAKDPELQNNSLLPLRDDVFSFDTVNRLKRLCYGPNR